MLSAGIVVSIVVVGMPYLYTPIHIAIANAFCEQPSKLSSDSKEHSKSLH